MKNEFSAIPGGTAPRLRVAVTHMDLLGNIITKSASRDPSLIGRVMITWRLIMNFPGRAKWLVCFLRPAIRMGSKALITPGTMATAPISFRCRGAANASVYTIQAADFAPETSLRLVAVRRDDYNNVVTVTSNVVRLASRVRGTLALTLQSEVLTDPVLLGLHTQEIFDLNGGGLISLTWSIGTDVLATEPVGPHAPVLTLARTLCRLVRRGLAGASSGNA